MRGKFITFEGSEGSGKSTQVKLLCAFLKTKGLSVLFLREPGGVQISEKIRQILLDAKNKRMTKICETLLYMAARSQLVQEVIRPALQRGQIVVCDRFLDSTLAYQGYGNGVDISFIKKLGDEVVDGMHPDLTIVMDMDVKKGLLRTGRQKDRIEQRSLNYHKRVHQGYLSIARAEPHRVKVVNAEGSKLQIQKEIQDIVCRRFNL